MKSGARLPGHIDCPAMLSALKEAFPEFAPACDAFVEDWSNETTELPYYILLGEFSRYLVRLLESNDGRQLETAFELIEALHRGGDEYVQNAAAVGILENLQNANLRERTTPDQFFEFLQPVALESWARLNDFWERGRTITSDP